MGIKRACYDFGVRAGSGGGAGVRGVGKTEWLAVLVVENWFCGGK